MKRYKLICVGFIFLAVLGGGMLYANIKQRPEAVDYAKWNPTPDEIRAVIGTASAPTLGMPEEERRDRFCTMFKRRFRDHNPAVAIGLKFISPTRIKLMCPARMEPFIIDQVALAAWREARTDIGKSIDMDIFDTFIGTSQVKIGELRTKRAAPDVALIAYDYRAVDLLNHPTHWKPYPGMRMGPLYQLPRRPPQVLVGTPSTPQPAPVVEQNRKPNFEITTGER